MSKNRTNITIRIGQIQSTQIPNLNNSIIENDNIEPNQLNKTTTVK